MQTLRKIVLTGVIGIGALLTVFCVVVAITSHSDTPAPAIPQTKSVASIPNPPSEPPGPVNPPPNPSPQATSEQPIIPPLRVSIDQLAADYLENEISADAKYKRKNLEVYGMVVKIQRNNEGHIVLSLRNFSDFGGVVALLDDDQEGKAAALRQLQGVHLLCVGGGLIRSVPVVGKCQIEERPHVTESPATEVQPH